MPHARVFGSCPLATASPVTKKRNFGRVTEDHTGSVSQLADTLWAFLHTDRHFLLC